MAKPIYNVSVIIPARNAATHLAGCLESIIAGTSLPNQIIVVDDASSDATGAIAKEFSVELITFQEHSGSGEARNAGIAAATGECLFFLDADCCASPEWLEQGLKAFQDPNVVGVAGHIFYESEPKSLREKVPVNPFYHRPGANPINASSRDYAGANIAYRAEALRQLQGFDTEFFSNGREDTDLAYRALGKGKIVTSTEMKVTHRKSLWTLTSLKESAERYESDVAFFARHGDFLFRKGHILHPRMLFLATFPLAIPWVYRRWLRSIADWKFLILLWIYFILVRRTILTSAIRHRIFAL